MNSRGEGSELHTHNRTCRVSFTRTGHCFKMPAHTDVKLYPLTGCGGLLGCEMLRIPHCLNNRLTDGDKVVSRKHRPRSTPQKHLFFYFWYSFLLEAGCTPGPSAAGRIRKIEDIHSSHQVSNSRPSGLQHSQRSVGLFVLYEQPLRRN
jgi:hypothetical protein